MGKERLKDPHHPTQKPLRVLEHIIKLASKEDDVVLDPFMGVGSTGEAAVKHGRQFIGAELDEKYFAAARRRLDAAAAKMAADSKLEPATLPGRKTRGASMATPRHEKRRLVKAVRLIGLNELAGVK